MKSFLLLLFAIIVAGFFVFSANSRRQEQGLKETAIARHRVTPGMTRAEVVASIGTPEKKAKLATDAEAWTYENRSIIVFAPDRDAVVEVIIPKRAEFEGPGQRPRGDAPAATSGQPGSR